MISLRVAIYPGHSFKESGPWNQNHPVTKPPGGMSHGKDDVVVWAEDQVAGFQAQRDVALLFLTTPDL